MTMLLVRGPLRKVLIPEVVAEFRGMRAHFSFPTTESAPAELPPLIRAKIIEYANEKAAGIYGGTETQSRRFTAKLGLYGLGEWPIRLRDVS
jgi:hypothetical protein